MQLQDMTIATLATNDFEDDELIKPRDALLGTGATVHVLSLESGVIVGKNGAEVDVDATLEDVRSTDYDALVLPGGLGNPDVLRTKSVAVAFVRDFANAHKPIAAICHGPWLLVEADALRGRTVTSWPSLKTDLVNAGASWIDREVVVDENIITSRNPDDIPAFVDAMIEVFDATTSDL
jgi:protease I